MSIIKKAFFPFINFYYRQRDKIIVPPYSEKRSIIMHYRDIYNLKILIETGTFLGDTIEAFKSDFDRLISFELSNDLAAKAIQKFKPYGHIHIINGDSGKCMTDHLKGIEQPCLFWLDGHYSSEFYIGEEFIKTAKGEKETPIVEELKSIFTHGVKNHVVLIDDARCFNGKNDYPTIKELKDLIHQFSPGAKLVIKRDIVRITPGKS